MKNKCIYYLKYNNIPHYLALKTNAGNDASYFFSAMYVRSDM